MICSVELPTKYLKDFSKLMNEYWLLILFFYLFLGRIIGEKLRLYLGPPPYINHLEPNK